ncbi:fumarylacetoacetate hydrolase family protein [Streptomyces spinosisporus]|jgi:acylpyruvate hydrolase|uniref:Fumarylacetoacetate hydrolase family protein n=1 Tax=Streptomyces spinosisporus TaxID=2927582 RepID=A0ABS9XUG8_9ACTN|nr:fumarylacetoacetate hydrolase family protein [Streptomyces spinosisporus]MCI3245701.1 fumarylacetoacetate hydrolase family protein [Streptomyces spinosisporus]
MTAPSAVDWTGGLGLARTATDDGPVVVLRRDADPAAAIALVDGQRHPDLPALLDAAAGDPSRITAGEVLDAPDRSLLSPVGRPGKIICIGQNYLDHVREGGRTGGPAYPDLFPKWHTCLSGPYADVPLPPESDQIDYESELAVVIGRRVRRVTAESASDVVFGYTAASDGSVRDYQVHTGQRTAGKAWDSLTPLGPVVVPAETLGGDRPDLAITGVLDGQVVQDDRTAKLLFGVPELIAYITTVMTLEPGDLILTGTPSGVGVARKPPLWLRDGSEFEVRIEGIGSLRNRYVAERVSP